MEKSRKSYVWWFHEKNLKTISQFLLAGLALFLVFQNLDVSEFKEMLGHANYFWFLPVILLIIISKVLSAVRMHYLFRCIQVDLGILYNIKLCFVGLYYNLFLPGGIGGDGYKVYHLHKHKQQTLKSLITATFLDRASGVWAISVLILVLAFFVQMGITFLYFNELVWIGLLLSIPVFYFIIRLFFPVYLPAFISTAILSLGVQGTQIICVWAILYSYDIHIHYASYAFLFLISSFAAMLPITIGGVGSREAVLLILPGILGTPIDTDAGVTMTLTFFILSVICAIPGALIRLAPIPKPVTISIKAIYSIKSGH